LEELLAQVMTVWIDRPIVLRGGSYLSVSDRPSPLAAIPNELTYRQSFKLGWWHVSDLAQIYGVDRIVMSLLSPIFLRVLVAGRSCAALQFTHPYSSSFSREVKAVG
jgi:hypothetical protein